jgi:superkiller protein 3
MSARDKIDKAKALLEANKVSEAEGQLRQAMALDRLSVEARVELARLLGATGRMVECTGVIDDALSLEPGNAEALGLKGLSLALQGDYKGAAGYYRKAITSDPRLGMAYSNLGGALRETGELAESESILRKGIEVEPKNFHIHYELAQTLAYQLRIKEAVFEVLETIKINPYFVRGYLALARLYHEGKEQESAIKILKECLKINPEAWEAAELLKDLLMLKGDFREARKVWEGVIAGRSDAGDYVQLGNIALSAGDFEQAEKAFKRAADLAPEAWEPNYALAELYDIANLAENAGIHYEQAVLYNQGAFEPHNGLGLYLLKQGEIEEAIRQLSLACELAPDDEPTPFFNLALAYSQAGQFAEAKRILEDILQGAPQGGLFDEMRRMLNAVKREMGK